MEIELYQYNEFTDEGVTIADIIEEADHDKT